ncbi:MAG: hypothetical protein AMXMBFR59_07450 [Rhodanobacteraceae bacterium]
MRQGNEAAEDTTAVARTAETLMPLLLDDLRRRARHERRRVRAGETLCTTALVHEAYLKLRRSDGWQGELHFLRAAALAMRQALVDHARQKLAAKHGGGAIDSLDALDAEPFWTSDEQLVALDEALQRLSVLNPRLTRVIECRFFAGYSEVDTARVLGITDRTVRRDWIKARAWLFAELGESQALPEPAAT